MKSNFYKIDTINETFQKLNDAKYFLKCLSKNDLRNLYNSCEGSITITHFAGDDIITTTKATPMQNYSFVKFGKPVKW